LTQELQSAIPISRIITLRYQSELSRPAAIFKNRADVFQRIDDVHGWLTDSRSGWSYNFLCRINLTRGAHLRSWRRVVGSRRSADEWESNCRTVSKMLLSGETTRSSEHTSQDERTTRRQPTQHDAREMTDSRIAAATAECRAAARRRSATFGAARRGGTRANRTLTTH